MSTGKYLIIFIALIGLTIGSNILLDNWHYKQGDHRRLQKEINKKFSNADRMFYRLMANNWKLETPMPENSGISLVVYRNDSLKYWSDNKMNFDFLSSSASLEKRFQFLANGWYAIKPYLDDSIRAYALILIKSQYPYENDFLTNEFHPDLKLPESTELLIEPQPGSYSIHDWEGIYLFSIKFSIHELRYARLEKYLIPALILLSLLCFFLLINRIIEFIPRARYKNILILILPVVFVLLRWLQYKYHIPADLYDLEMFGPIPFAKSELLPSLGDMLINTTLIMFAVIQFYLHFKLPEKAAKGRGPDSTIVISLLIILLTSFYFYSHTILSNLILHSIISFEFYKAASLSVYTIIGLIIMAMHFAVILFLSNKLLTLCKRRCKFRKLILVFSGIVAIMFYLHQLVGFEPDYGSHVVYLIIFVVLAILQYRRIPLGNYTAMTLMVILFSAYSVYIITHFEYRKTGNNMEVMAENLAAQHDPVAEYLLEEISSKLRNDKVLNNFMFNYNISTEEIHDYLQANYFNGFWGKYKLWHTDCNPATEDFFNDSLQNCYQYYQSRMTEGKSMHLPGTQFYFLDSQNGRINYLGWITYTLPGKRSEMSLFLELESRLVAEELGFPDLLLDKKYQKNKLLEEYSYAKYYKNQLLAQSGAFQYSLDLNTYKNQSSNFSGFRHYIHYVNRDNVVMVSKPTSTFFDKLVSFSYIFIFYYFIIIVFIVIRDFSKLGKDIEFNFKNKIQFAITAIIFLSLILVGGGTIYFSIEQYQKRQHDILGEKIQSVYIELDHLLAYFPERIPPDWKGDGYDNLNQLLIKFSDVFYSDINLYDPEGNLMATSRSEIFDEGIL